MATEIFPELQALAERLRERPAVDTPASKPLLMYGYVSVEGKSSGYVEACVDLLTWWSVFEGWRLGVVFRDVGAENCLTRPGFEGLVDVLRLPDSAGAIVVHREQLSAEPSISKEFEAAIRRTGSSLRVLADELQTPS